MTARWCLPGRVDSAKKNMYNTTSIFGNPPNCSISNWDYMDSFKYCKLSKFCFPFMRLFKTDKLSESIMARNDDRW